MADTESIKELFLRRLQKVLSIVSLATVVLLLLQVTTGIAGRSGSGSISFRCCSPPRSAT